MVKVDLKYQPGKGFPWRVVNTGTDKCVQVYGEGMAYKNEFEAMDAINEGEHELISVIVEK